MVSHAILFQAYYEVKLIEELPVDFGEDHQETDPHILRIGWSLDSTSFQLGEIYFIVLAVKKCACVKFLENLLSFNMEVLMYQSY